VGKLLSPVHLGGRNSAPINYQVIKTNGLVFRPPCYRGLERTDRTAFPPSQPHQLSGQPGRRPDRLLPSAKKAFSRGATPHSTEGLTYPELTLVNPKLAQELRYYPLNRLKQETGLHIFPVLTHPQALQVALEQLV